MVHILETFYIPGATLHTHTNKPLLVLVILHVDDRHAGFRGHYT